MCSSDLNLPDDVLGQSDARLKYRRIRIAEIIQLRKLADRLFYELILFHAFAFRAVYSRTQSYPRSSISIASFASPDRIIPPSIMI